MVVTLVAVPWYMVAQPPTTAPPCSASRCSVYVVPLSLPLGFQEIVACVSVLPVGGDSWYATMPVGT